MTSLSKQDHVWFVYLLNCSDQTIYTGITTDLDRRLQEHNGIKPGGAKYTKARRPVSLIKSFQCHSRSEASKLESQIKKLPRNQKLIFELQKDISMNEAVSIDEFKSYLNSLIGQTEEQASEQLNSNGWKVRVSKRDGQANILTRDYKTDRVNLDIEDGIVAAIHIG